LGETYLKTKISNLETKRYVVMDLLVDTGTTVSIVAKNRLLAIGIKPIYKARLTLADGTTIARDEGVAMFTIKGKHTFGPVIFGEPKDDNLLGVTVLETLGFSMDFKTGRLRRKRIRF